MGKKNKHKFRDIWDVDTKEQMDAVEDFDKFEKGEVSIFDIGGKVKQPPLTDNGVRKDLAQVIARDLQAKQSAYAEKTSMKVDETSTPDYDEVISGSKNQKTIPYAAIRDGQILAPSAPVKEEHKEEPKKETKEVPYVDTNIESEEEITCNRLLLIMDKTLDRLVIDDGISPTTLSFMYDKCPKMKGSNYDDSDVADRINILYYFIITNKFPQAIYDQKEFVENFGQIISLDRSKFIIFANMGYFMVYDLDEDFRKDFESIPDYYSYDADMTLNMYVTLAMRTADINNTFFGDSRDDVEVLYDAEDLNAKDDVFGDICNDKNTIKGKAIKDLKVIKENLGVLDYEGLQNVGADMIRELTSEEPEEEVKEEAPHVTEESEADVEEAADTAEINLDMPEEAEAVETPVEEPIESKPEAPVTPEPKKEEEPHKDTNPMGLTVPVIHKKH